MTHTLRSSAQQYYSMVSEACLQFNMVFFRYSSHFFIFLHTLLLPLICAIRKHVDPIIDDGCDPVQRRLITHGWLDSRKLAQAHAEWTPQASPTPGSLQKVMDIFLGTKSRLDGRPDGTPGPLRQNILRAQGIFVTDAEWSPIADRIQARFYCDDKALSEVLVGYRKPLNVCPGTVEMHAHTFQVKVPPSPYNPHKVYFILLCSAFFQEPNGLRLNQAQPDISSDARNHFHYWKRTRGVTMLHEVYHWDIVSNPRCNLQPEVYSTKDVLRLARENNTEIAQLNGE